MAKDDTSDLAKMLEKFGELQLKIVEASQKTSLSEEALEAILTRVGASSAKSMQQALRPENEFPPLISAFNPKGDRDYAKPKLKRKTFLNDHPEHTNEGDLRAEMLTEEEILKYNDLGAAVEASGGMLDARNGQYVAELRNRNTELHVTIKGLSKIDVQQNLPPSLILLCHEIQTGESMNDINALLKELLLARQELAAMRGEAIPTSVGPVGGRQAKPVTITGRGGPLAADLERALDETSHETLR